MNKMKKILIIGAMMLSTAMTPHAAKKVVVPDVSVSNLRVENMVNPLAMDTSSPRFSWVINSKKQNVRQTAYQIVVTGNKGELWNSGKI